MSTTIRNLTPNNVRALREVFDLDGDTLPVLETTATTATFYGGPAWAATMVMEEIARLPGRGHPKASLHAVLRKLKAEGSSQ